MNTRSKFAPLFLATAIAFAAFPVRADEIRLKDGKKLNGVIVAYEDNMFKVKTDFGYVLVEKDKIAAIIPTGASAKKEKEPAKKEPDAEKSSEPKSAQPDDPNISTPIVQPASEKAPVAKPVAKKETPPAKSAAARPSSSSVKKGESPALRPGTDPAAIATTSPEKLPATSAAAPLAPAPAPPKEPETPPNREEIQGNTYTNFTHHFRMYKAPSWELIEDARRALPNAVVAMGTNNESTLLVVGEEKSGVSLDAEAANIEKRLRDVYENYRRISQEKTTVAGQPAVQFKYMGKADDHDWSGTLVVVSRGATTVTILGMTYADNDLIQIQENVINRAISSLDFGVQ